MKVLFIVSDIFLGEPMGVLQLSACLKKHAHKTKLIALKKHPLATTLKQFNPDVIAYSAMTPDADLFKKADKIVLNWANASNKRILRIMGGPHATFFPDILEELRLDAICIGEGDNAIVKLVDNFQRGRPLTNIVNVSTDGKDIDFINKELVSNLDELPFVDRDIYYEAMPIYRSLGLRGFMIGRGCPYDCTYCHNHAFKEIFKGCGKILRRRSVVSVLTEIKNVLNKYGLIKLIKISDDTFAHTVDDWVIEFLEKYKKEINIPFYCLMRSNTLTEEMAQLLSSAGCISIGMSIETGNEYVRNEILKRGLSDKVVIDSFGYARKYKIHTYGNTLLGLPGTKFIDDMESFIFTKKLKVTAPTFGVFNPYPKLRLTNFALEQGFLSPDYSHNAKFGFKSPLNTLTEKEKNMQLNLSYLGPLFSDLPYCFMPLLKILIRIKALKFYKFIGYTYHIYKVAFFIFPGSVPLSPLKSIKIFLKSIKYFTPKFKSYYQLET